MLTTQAAVRAAFWNDLGVMGAPGTRKPGKTQNNYPADVRMAWVDYVDMLQRSGEISEALAFRVTL
jgi:hypothetical protein